MLKRLALGLLALSLLSAPALAAPNATVSYDVGVCDPSFALRCVKPNVDGSVNVTGSFSATLAGFAPNGNYGSLTATAASSASTALPSGAVVQFTNLTAIDVSCVLSTGAATATTNKLIVPHNSTQFFTVGTNVNAACINQTGAASNVIMLAGGTGLGTNFGGGGSSGGGGAITIASGAVASGAYASGAYASGSIASGAFASGAVSSGAFSSGALASGAVVDLTNLTGTKAPGTAAANSMLVGGVYTAAGITLTTGQQAALQFDSTGHLLTTASVGGLGQGSTTSGQTGILDMGAVTTAAPSYTTAQTSPLSLTVTGDMRVFDAQLHADATAAIPAGTNIIGKVGIDQTTPGTTNGVQDASTGATGSAVPSKASLVGANSGGNMTALVQADASAAINVSTATTTQLVALASTKKIYVTSFDVIAGGTGNITFEYGTGANCGTGTTVLTGAYNLTAQAGIAKGNGLGPVLVVPASNALCVVTSAAVQMSGSVAYTQF